MLAVLNISNVLLVTIFGIAFSVSMIDYFLFKKDTFLYLGAMFILFIADLTVISLTENVPWFKKAYDNLFLSVPTWKTLVYAGVFFCILMSIPKIFGLPMKKLPFILLAILILYMLFIPVMENKAFKSWLYYEPNQFFLFGIGVYLIYKSRHIDLTHISERLNDMLNFVGKLFCVFAVLILIEDTYVIFFVDHYKDVIYINNRSFTEDIFRVVFAIVLVIYEYIYLKEHINSSVNDSEMIAIVDEGVDNEAAEQKVEEKRYSKLFLYSKEYQLTVREQEILGLLISGKKTQEIADTLQISIGTAKTHIHNIFSKVGVSRRSLLIKNYDDYTTEEFTLKKINEIFS
ncbi:MAG: helix-turn-helix transcriptional regulator [Lachnospiraceae bacterium]|nr:helix-turn-helix transcriptional regulator [Lachnospiraceae bacterium]